VKKEKPLHFFLERYTQAYMDEVKEFASACLGNHEVSCNGFDGLQAERIARAAKQSLETGVPVHLNQAEQLGTRIVR
jgi:myo-inositol 2-dehydrogenase / D-chiro-inositol 1-dehydrogenase